MAEGARLLSVYRRNPIPGSNPGRSASFSYVKCMKYKGFIDSIETPPVPGQSVKLNLKITLNLSRLTYFYVSGRPKRKCLHKMFHLEYC